MSAINRTTINLLVNAIFALDIHEDIAKIEQKDYTIGTFATHDYALAVSMMWDARTRLLSLMPGVVTTVDQPRPGTYAAERNEHQDHRDRAAERKECEFSISVLARVEEHLAAKAKDETEKVKGEGITQTKFYEFRPYMSTLKSFIDDRREWAVANLDTKAKELQIAKLDELARLDEGDFEGAGIGINEALEKFAEMVKEGDNLDRVAHNAWAKLRSNLIAYQQGLEKYEDAQVFVSSLERDEPGYDSAMSKFAKLSGEWKTLSFKLPKAIENNLAATPLLAHAGVPKDLVNSPEWRTMVVKANSEKMEREAALLEAQLREVKAKQNQLDIAKRMAALQLSLRTRLIPRGLRSVRRKPSARQQRRLLARLKGLSRLLRLTCLLIPPRTAASSRSGANGIPDYNTHR
ncbi:MAG: hypothetical protein IPK44_01090 [Candidatus Accumulibacter sp.]|uniref:hypothetical protein n=1 Tax=Accumulibacter sp. TaxID=2053492 RepID=UPI00258DEF83|nr:hypothetical protein [Accumulibacter sp.]MBK8113193.1 hypothetical protein [Accumulibacter sp.]